ncbi:hotdog fold thioesterase [Gordonia pseudamarae]|jgi:1,4-dihydroxy-2-naphthoyl-CoA hydrolase|uniref:Hotdog fold thioesterase n=1 Tax=Gordonia pseudamarae TaxID=2831662 RepID=A0ABX6II30_9ACTN|nr:MULTISPECIES: PaaI family thioesterase [Gordonia]MBD0024077.1 PaaI family thioesterase [Gordonia sp. (in: high G+C Gram-positive bacteria)]QHN26624.1 hotdog fold thioesterase [Gordonia pseudamarae]QHN35517.1 hotdog fold thioesterase [Gordonia pseudamarae]
MSEQTVDDFLNNPAASVGFDAQIGQQITSVDADGLTATLELSGRHHQPFGIVHGGVYCAVAESAASMSGAVWLHHTGIGGTAVGVNNNTDFLRSVSEGTITVRTSPIHRGRRQQLWAVDFTDADGRPLAHSQVRLQNIELPADGGE